MKRSLRQSVIALVVGVLSTISLSAPAKARPADAENFYKSAEVTTEKVTFNNQYKMKVVGNLIVPPNFDKNKKYPGIIVGHPMGAVKE